jgi:hypothetical protein
MGVERGEVGFSDKLAVEKLMATTITVRQGPISSTAPPTSLAHW